MTLRALPWTLLLLGAVEQNAAAQARPDPIGGATEEDTAIPPADPYVTGTHTTTDRPTETEVITSQTSTVIVERQLETFAGVEDDVGDDVDWSSVLDTSIGLDAGGGVNE